MTQSLEGEGKGGGGICQFIYCVCIRRQEVEAADRRAQLMISVEWPQG
jgi:hypothetical protein